MMPKILKSITISLFFLLALAAWTAYGLTGHDKMQVTQYAMFADSRQIPPPNSTAMLKVCTLNIAHGRSNGFHQFFQSEKKIQQHLNNIAKLLQRVRPDIVALQEADAESFWSGAFNHVQYLAEKSHMHSSVQGKHVQGMGLQYGTALLSRLPLQEGRSIRFASTPPTPPKGFVIATTHIPGHPQQKIDVVSLHLDFLRARARSQQLETLSQLLQARQNPVIIMGDFNTGWHEQQILKNFAEKLTLHTWQPEQNKEGTFWMSDKRIDWILLSKELEFVNYRVLPDVVSDHRAVVAQVRLHQPT